MLEKNIEETEEQKKIMELVTNGLYKVQMPSSFDRQMRQIMNIFLL